MTEDEIKANIKKVFTLYPETRDNYNLALFRYWELNDNPSFKVVAYSIDVTKITSASAIIWRMREIQNKEGLFKPSKEVQDMRSQAGRNIAKKWATT